MNLSPVEQANACYFLRKERQKEFAQLAANINTPLEILRSKWQALELIMEEEKRLYAKASK